MKTAPDNTPLDAFIKETLKASDANLSLIDWSEVEVLLRHEKKSISVGVDKKTLTYAGAGLAVLIVIFGIFKIVQHYSSLPDEPETPTDSTQSILSPVDTLRSAVIDSAITKPDTAKADTSHAVVAPPKIDSSAINKSNKKIDSGLVKPPLMPDSAWIRRIHEKQDKKKKQAALKDSSPVKMDIIQPIIHVDTTLFKPTREIKIEQATPPIDTITKSGAPKNNAKSKKTKKTTTPPAEIKSDSLK